MCVVSCLCSFVISEAHASICLLEKSVHPMSSSLCGSPAVLYLTLDRTRCVCLFMVCSMWTLILWCSTRESRKSSRTPLFRCMRLFLRLYLLAGFSCFKILVFYDYNMNNGKSHNESRKGGFGGQILMPEFHGLEWVTWPLTSSSFFQMELVVTNLVSLLVFFFHRKCPETWIFIC